MAYTHTKITFVLHKKFPRLLCSDGVKMTQGFLCQQPAGNLSSQMMFSLRSWQVLNTKFFLAPFECCVFPLCSLRFQLWENFLSSYALRLRLETSRNVQRLKDFQQRKETCCGSGNNHKEHHSIVSTHFIVILWTFNACKILFIRHAPFISEEKLKFHYFGKEYNFKKLNTIHGFLWSCILLAVFLCRWKNKTYTSTWRKSIEEYRSITVTNSKKLTVFERLIVAHLVKKITRLSWNLKTRDHIHQNPRLNI